MRYGDLPNSAIFFYGGREFVHFKTEHNYPQEIIDGVSGKLVRFEDDDLEVQFSHVHVNKESLPMTGVTVEFGERRR